jgi:hypothetical protein
MRHQPSLYTSEDLINIYHENIVSSELLLEKVIIQGLGSALADTSFFKNEYVRVWAKQAKIHMENRESHDQLYIMTLNGSDLNTYIEFYRTHSTNFHNVYEKLRKCAGNISLSIVEL